MTEADEKFLNKALDELAQHLNAEPIKLTVSIKRLGDKPKLAEKVCERLSKLSDKSYEFSACSGEITYIFDSEEGIGQRLLIYCRSDSYVAKAARKRSRLPSWGAAYGPFSAVYKPNNKFIIWHETLHTLGLDDCYDEKCPDVRKPDCKCKDCVMQYERPDTWIGPFSLCNKNIERLQELAKKVEEIRQGKMTS